jgi:hypothetical protein
MGSAIFAECFSIFEHLLAEKLKKKLMECLHVSLI